MEDLELEIQREASPSGSPPQERASEPGPPTLPSPPSPPAGSAVHALQTKVRAVSYRPGRRERRRDKKTSDIQPGGPGWSLVIPREKARGKGRVNPPVSLKYPECGGALSSSEEEEEDGELEVQVEVEVEVARLHLNTSPPDMAGEPEARSSRRGGRENGSDGGPVGTASCQPVPPRGLGEGSSVENLRTDVSSSTTDGPSPSKPAPPSSSSLSFLMTSASSSSSSTTTSSSSSRHWAPPKGFWRVVRPETLHLNGAEPLCAAASLPVKDHTLMSSLIVKDYSLTTSLPVKDYNLTSSLPVKDHTLMSSIPVKDYSRTSLPMKDYTLTSSLPVKDYTQDYTSLLHVKDYTPTASLPMKELDEHQRTMLEEADWGGAMATPWELQRSDSLENYLDRCERRGAEPGLENDLPVGGLWRADSCESVCSQGGALSIDERVEANQRARGRRGRPEREEGLCVDNPYRYGDEVSRREDRGGCLDSDSNRLVPVSYPRSLFQSEELPLSPRHEQAKLLLERARLKARSNHVKGERPTRRSQSDQRYNHLRRQQQHPAPPQNPAELKTTEGGEVPAPAPPQPGPLLVPQETDSSNGDRRLRHQGYSPTRVRFEDESEREAESRYLDRVRERGRSHKLKAGKKEKRVDPVIAVAPHRQEEAGPAAVETAWGQEVTLRKCEACGSILRDPPPMAGKPQAAPTPLLSNDDQSEKPTSRWAPPPSQSEPSAQGAKVKVPVVTFAGAFILGEDGCGGGRGGRGGGGGWGKRSGFGKLRRRSRKGESRLESGNGPYGPSWAQRRNSLPRPRGYAPIESPTERPPVGNSRESPTPPLPIKSALKSSSRPRPSTGPSVQFRLSQAGEPGGPVGLGALETGVEGGLAPSQAAGPPALVPCIRPSSLRYSSARITPDLPPAELWDTPSDGGVVLAADSSPPIPEFRPRGLGVSRTDDLRAELLRSEHLKAEGQWEDGPEGARSRGPGKLSLRRFFSSLGLNSVGRLVKGGRSSSMEQLSVPSPRTSSPSPTRRPHSPTRLQRTPSLQALNTVSPLAQLRKASSVQSLERRAERSTILGELHVPYGLAPRELQRALSVEEVLAPGGALRPVVGALRPAVSQPLQDGTLLLEISRPPNGPFGFLISRGKGRPDTGVYIEQVGGGPGEGQYMGLLGVGDEILEVNGEAVGGLTLDQVTRLMTRDSTASLRILPCRRSPR